MSGMSLKHVQFQSQTNTHTHFYAHIHFVYAYKLSHMQIKPVADHATRLQMAM